VPLSIFRDDFRTVRAWFVDPTAAARPWATCGTCRACPPRRRPRG
jgi:hypothetical protein